MFVGYSHSAYDVARIVFSCISMISPPMPCMLSRVFAYANLYDLSFLDVDGYIAGVTNPMFAQRYGTVINASGLNELLEE